MVDNVAITAGSGTTIGTDDVGGIQIQRVKVTWGPDGTANDTDVASGKIFPVQDLGPITTYSGRMTLTAATSTGLIAANVTMDTNSAALPAAGSFARLVIIVMTGTANVCWFGGTASASLGEAMGDGTNVGTDMVNLTGAANAPTLFSTAGATIYFRN